MGRISMPQGKGSDMHNRRAHTVTPPHIDASRAKDNIVLVDKDLKTAYDEVFGDAINRYNAKQNRADRKKSDYLEEITHSKNREKLFYEDILQWGSREDFKKHPELRQVAKECLVEYYNSWPQRNPALKLTGFFIHDDETSPHAHIDFIPVATGYKTGMDTRNSITKAMQSMGFEDISKKQNSTKAWKERERAFFGEICRAHGLIVDKELPSPRENYDKETYIAYKEHENAIKKLSRTQDELSKTNEELSVTKKALAQTKGKIEELYNNSTETIQKGISHLRSDIAPKEFDRPIFSVDKPYR